MKTIKSIALFIACASASFAMAENQDAKADKVIELDKAHGIEAVQPYSRSYYYPKRMNQYGQVDYIFITALNGNQFCEEEGYNEMIGGSIYCGEDESSYTTYDWYQRRWESLGTGSKNQCYPLFRTITCR
ncbi:hypothetical protein [Pleionea sp. CnH1-48]|uniref:hypothetical protein n=1 Tax=Pleionea sp. CnH1-48 TaxID=2954494 RepID=UPI002097E92B|nr:hypothetical protein [Pleionea sp. CnH1-48]MCO7223438.1 hypothetical protein [Pleionea sp. CnH1-48]